MYKEDRFFFLILLDFLYVEASFFGFSSTFRPEFEAFSSLTVSTLSICLSFVQRSGPSAVYFYTTYVYFKHLRKYVASTQSVVDDPGEQTKAPGTALSISTHHVTLARS